MSFEWAAGLFEGEGSLVKNKRLKNGWRLMIAMTDEDVVQKFADVMDTGNKVHRYEPRRENYKVIYRWECGSRAEITRIVLEFLPFLGERRLQKAHECLDSFGIDYIH